MKKREIQGKPKMIEKNRAILEAIGLTSVVLSLMFVAYQIQQSNQIARVTNELDIRGNFSALNESVMNDSEMAALLDKATSENVSFDGPERIKITMFVLRLMNVWLANETAYTNGMLPQTSYEIVFDDIRMLFGTFPGLRYEFRSAYELYPGWRLTAVFREIEQQLIKYGL